MRLEHSYIAMDLPRVGEDDCLGIGVERQGCLRPVVSPDFAILVANSLARSPVFWDFLGFVTEVGH